MSILVERFREKTKKSKDFRMKNETEYDVAYPTGFLAFDFLNGTVVHVESEEKKYSYNSIGIVDGSMVTIVGRSGCGKTTFIMQSAAQIIKPFETSCIYHDDIEGGIVQSRKELLLEMDGFEMKERYISRNTGITAENFFERVKMIHDLKMEDRAAYEYDTGLFNSEGERIYKLEPTIYILDSLAMLMPEKYTDEDELSGQMSTTAAAKTNASIFRRIIPMLKTANIILFVVNHITDDVQINLYAKKQAQLSFLKQGERLGGGKTPVYLSNLLIRMDDHSKMKPTEGFCINGTLVTATLLKSRTSAAGNAVNLVFDYEHGFDRELSLFYTMKELGFINGAGAYMYFGDRSDIKFAQKQLKQKLQENPELQKVFMEEAYKALMTLINNPADKEANKGKFSITQSILQNMNNMQNVA